MRRTARFALLSLCGLLAAVPRPAAAQQPARNLFTAKTLLTGLSDPTGVAFLPDGQLYLLLKGGTVRLYNPADSSSVTAATLSIYSAQEGGLHSIALDPGFATNRRLYLLFTTRATGDSVMVLARFTAETTGLINTGSRIDMLRVPMSLASNAEHTTGSLAFNRDGDLFIGLGDNTKNYTTGAANAVGYAPRNPANPPYDAQRSAANSNDLRGKILRIRPLDNGSYAIPAGNLFAPGRDSTRPEIYAMGMRHPFRISTDPLTGWVYWGEPGPNAPADVDTLGPRGYDEINLARSPGNYGWPYCAGNNFCYREHNYATGAAGAAHKADSLRNASPLNTGIRALPPARPALAWYPYLNSTPAFTTFPVFGQGTTVNVNTSMIGPVYRYDPQGGSARLPAYYDGHLFHFDFSRSVVQALKLNDSGAVDAIVRFWDPSSAGSNPITGPIDLKFAPDGSLYFVAWGNTSYPSNGGSGRLVRLSYTGPHDPVSVDSRRPAGGEPRRDLLFTAHFGGVFALPGGAVRADFFTLRGQRLWTLRDADAPGHRAVALPDGVRGLVRVRLSYR